MKKIKIPVITTIISLLILGIQTFTSFQIGIIIDRYKPCVQNPMSSLPCFYVYDIYLALFLMGALGISLLWIIIYFAVAFYKNKKHA